MENRSKGIIIILSVLLIVAGVAAVYFGISLSGMETKLDNLENKVENGPTNNENKESSDKIEIKEESIDNTSNILQATEKIVYKYVPSLENGKCLNAKENMIYTPNRTAEFEGINVILKDSGKNVEINVNGSLIKEIYPYVNFNEYKNYTITNFSKNVVNVYIKGIGHSVGNEVLYFLMEDGTVEYMPINKALKTNEFKSYGKIENVLNIVDIVGGSANYDLEGKGYGPGGFTTFAINNEGNYYDIGAIVQGKMQ